MRLVVGSGPFSFALAVFGSCRRDDGTPPVTRTKMSFDTAQRRVHLKTAHDVSVVRASFYVPARGYYDDFLRDTGTHPDASRWLYSTY